jgi:hypothetical protein
MNVIEEEGLSEKPILTKRPAPRVDRPRPTDKLADYRDQWMNYGDGEGPRSIEPEYV